MALSDSVSILKEYYKVLGDAIQEARINDFIPERKTTCNADDFGVMVSAPTFAQDSNCLLIPPEDYYRYQQAWTVVKDHLPPEYVYDRFSPLDMNIRDAYVYLEGAFTFVKSSSTLPAWMILGVAVAGVATIVALGARRRSSSFFGPFGDWTSGFAQEVIDAAQRVSPGKGRTFGQGVYISAVYEEARRRGFTGSLPDFKKRLATEDRAGRLSLLRAELVSAHDPDAMTRSAMTVGGGFSRHLVELPGPPPWAR